MELSIFTAAKLRKGLKMNGFEIRNKKLEIPFSRVINGKRYDTTTAKSVGFNYRTASCPDEVVYEELFLKKTGEFFLYYKFVLANKWNVGACSNKELIIPKTYEEAMEWAEEHADADSYEEAFAEVSE
jgi:hypothetical protein